MSDNNQWTFSQEFSANFAAECAKLSARIGQLESSVPNETIAELSAELSRLTKDLADAIGSLPSYDQKGYENQLKAIGASLEALRRTSKPASKFAFKRKPAAPQATPQTREQSVPSSLSVTPAASDAFVLTISAFSGENVSVDSPTTAAKDLAISDLTNCIVNVVDHTSIAAVHVRRVRNTIILLPHLQSTIMMHDMDNCVVVVGCHQFRMHTSHGVDVYLSISSNPIIEHCSEIRFGGYPTSLPTSSPITNSSHLSVQDFSHIKATPSPNWSPLPEGKPLEWPLDSDGDIDEILTRYLPNPRD